MASRFVSAGGAELKAPEGLTSATDDAWAKARQQVEESKKPREEAPAPGTQEGGISLFEHLQNQKAAKQEAFEEASKLRNQFRPLDDREVDFLEGIKQRERLKLAAERQETTQQLEAFRRERATEGASLGDGIIADASNSADQTDNATVWTTAKKRRKNDLSSKPAPAKARKLSPADSAGPTANSTERSSKSDTPNNGPKQDEHGKVTSQVTPAISAKQTPVPAKPLIGYDSDSDD